MERITRNWKIKAGSLFIASLLFWYVQYSKTVTRVINIRIEKPDVPADMVMDSRIPVFMNVKMYGPRELMEFNVNEFRIILSNPSPEAGENLYRTQLSPDLPEGINAVYNRELKVSLDKVAVRELPIIADLNVNIKEGFKAGYILTNPAVVRVKGPEKLLNTLERVRTERIMVNTSSSFFRTKALISDLPEFVAVESKQAHEVEVSARIIPEKLRTEAGTAIDQDLVFLDDIPVKCRNDIRGISMRVLSDRKVSAVILRSADSGSKPVVKEQFTAEVFCPVFYSTELKKILPWDTVMNMPVYLTDKSGRTDLVILDVEPAKLSLQFERVIVQQPTGIRQGLQEHLIR
jgi:hypothetical protein